MAIKTGTAYKVTSGYKIYDTITDYDTGTISDKHGAGTPNEFTWDSASALFAGAAMITASLLA